MDRITLRGRAALAGAIAIATIGMANSAQAANLLQNPGFENPTASGTESTTIGFWTPYANAERATFQHHTGTWSAWERTFEPAGGFQQVVTGIVPNTPYTLSAWQYFEANFNTLTGTTVDFELTWEDGAGNPVGTPNILNLAAGSQPTTTWTQFTLNSSTDSNGNPVVAPTGSSQVQVSFDYRGPGASGASLSAFLDDADLEGAGTIPANAWGINGSGDWNTGANWSLGTVPNGAGAEADFFTAITDNHNVFTDIAVSAGILNFNNAKTYVIDGAGSLTLQAAAGNANVIVQQGVQELNLPVTIASNTVFNVSPGATLVIGNPLTVSAGKSVTTTGGGTVTYNSIITLQTGATLAFANSTHAAALDLLGTSAATLASHTGATQSILQLDALNVGGTLNNWTSKVDLTNNAMIVHNGSLTNITNQLKAGFNAGSGYWNGNAGIVSSAAASDTRHLTALGSRQSNGSTFNGMATTTSDVLVKYTYYGDATLDGQVNGADYQQIDMGFGTGATGWQNGDFNYDGVVNGSDFALIDNTFNQITATSAGSLATASDPIATPEATAAVPEPASLSILGFAALTLLNNRRRRLQ